MNFIQEQISDILVELANKGGTYLGQPNIRSFSSLPNGDYANSERSEESIL